jgi:hypothetical protein
MRKIIVTILAVFCFLSSYSQVILRDSEGNIIKLESGSILRIEEAVVPPDAAGSFSVSGNINSTLNTGIVSYWDFEETTGSTAYDTVSVYHGTLIRTPTMGATGVIGNCFSYAAADSEYVDFGNNYYDFDLNDLSASGWIKLNSLGVWQGITGGAGGDTWWGVYIKPDNKLYGVLNFEPDTGHVEVVSNDVLLSGTWYHFVLRINRDGDVSLDLDGVSQQNKDDISDYSGVGLSNENYHVVANHGKEFHGSYFDGLIDELGVWNKLITDSEINDLNNSGSGFGYPFLFGCTDSLQMLISTFDADADSFRVNYAYGNYPTSRTDGTLLFAFGIADTADYNDTTFLWTDLVDEIVYWRMWTGENDVWTTSPNQDTCFKCTKAIAPPDTLEVSFSAQPHDIGTAIVTTVGYDTRVDSIRLNYIEGIAPPATRETGTIVLASSDTNAFKDLQVIIPVSADSTYYGFGLWCRYGDYWTFVPNEDSVVLNTIEPINTFTTSRKIGPANDSIKLETLGYDVEGDTVRINWRYDSIPTSITDGTLLYAFPMSDSSDYHDTTAEWTGIQDTTIFIAAWSGKGDSWTVTPNEDSVGLLFADTANSFDVSFAHQDIANELEDDLFAYYDFEESAGDVLDQVGSNDLSVNGTVTREVTGRVGDCYTFATNGYLGEEAGTFNFTGSFSISLWMKSDDTDAYSNIVSDLGGVNHGYELIIRDFDPPGSGIAGVIPRNGVAPIYVYGNDVVNDDAWHHIVFSYSDVDDSIKLWVDGQIDDWDVYSGGIVYHADVRFTIARKDGVGVSTSFYNGEIDEIGIWDGTELSESEVTSLYNSGSGITYPFPGAEDADSVRMQVSGFDNQADSFRVSYTYTAYPTLVTEGTLQFAFGPSDTTAYKDTIYEWTGYQDTIVYYTLWSRLGGAWTSIPNKDTVQIGTSETYVPPTGYNIVFSQNFDHHISSVPTKYTYGLWSPDWLNDTWRDMEHRYPAWWATQEGQDRINDSIILDDLSSSPVMKMSFIDTFASGYYGQGPNRGGDSWTIVLPGGSYYELYLSFNVRFKEGFEAVSSGGKLGGGFWGGTYFNHGKVGEPEYGQGFSAEAMFNGNPAGHSLFYVYSQTKPPSWPYGQSWSWEEFTPSGTNLQYKENWWTGNVGFYFNWASSDWYNITLRCVINSHAGSSPNYNGILEAYVNGKLVGQRTNCYLITYPDELTQNYIHSYMFRSFFGGGQSWPQKDEWIYFDDFVLWQYDEDEDVVRGNNAWSGGTELTLPPEANISKIDL